MDGHSKNTVTKTLSKTYTGGAKWKEQKCVTFVFGSSKLDITNVIVVVGLDIANPTCQKSSHSFGSSKYDENGHSKSLGAGITFFGHSKNGHNKPAQQPFMFFWV